MVFTKRFAFAAIRVSIGTTEDPLRPRGRRRQRSVRPEGARSAVCNARRGGIPDAARGGDRSPEDLGGSLRRSSPCSIGTAPAFVVAPEKRRGIALHEPPVVVRKLVFMDEMPAFPAGCVISRARTWSSVSASLAARVERSDGNRTD